MGFGFRGLGDSKIPSLGFGVRLQRTSGRAKLAGHSDKALGAVPWQGLGGAPPPPSPTVDSENIKTKTLLPDDMR